MPAATVPGDRRCSSHRSSRSGFCPGPVVECLDPSPPSLDLAGVSSPFPGLDASPSDVPEPAPPVPPDPAPPSDGVPAGCVPDPSVSDVPGLAPPFLDDYHLHCVRVDLPPPCADSTIGVAPAEVDDDDLTISACHCRTCPDPPTSPIANYLFQASLPPPATPPDVCFFDLHCGRSSSSKKQISCTGLLIC